ncbi:MAG: cysteine synthase A [Shimia sp.]|uniref:cysteine synthase A n=1 Tax=Shimia sp. TaxID=1954381 RepID=UPI001B0E87B2|nr:cysteine synthase A [Shimia sp.]MBO6897541.1 cysteine synthase A [Shimia sp.]
MPRQTHGRGRRYDSILDTVGDTPVVRLNRIAPQHVNMFVKFEAANPGGSVKDRLALNIIEAAEKDGRLKPGQTVVEATSGNTGIGLAMVCAAKGYPLVITMSEAFSVERRRLMRFLGARVVLTPKAQKGFGMYKKAQELAAENGWFLASQFETADNADMHESTTAREILNDFADTSLDYWVTGYGTGGTVAGVSRVLRRESPDTKIILSEPANAALVDSGYTNTRDAAHQATESHPAFEPHPIQGWTPDFIPWVLQEALDNKGYDQLIKTPGPDGITWSRRLAAEEGIMVGISAGATLAAAIEVAENAPEGSNILVMLPDTGERYLSTPLFEGIPEGMSDEELTISHSTPSAQL